MNEASRWLRVRYYANLSLLYGLTLLFGAYLVHPFDWFAPTSAAPVLQSYSLSAPVANRVAGRPVRIVIPDSNVDLPVDLGFYDPATKSWSLSGYNAQYANVTSLANNVGGNTFIYGHNNNYVFGALRHVPPSPGAQALIYTDNGHILVYKFQKLSSVAPDDTSVFTYHGPSILTVQTCTGSLNEWRTLYRFSFSEVRQ